MISSTLIMLMFSLSSLACIEIPMGDGFIGRYIRVGGNGGVMIATEKSGSNHSFVYKFDKSSGRFAKYESPAVYEGYPLHKSKEKCGDFEEFVSPKNTGSSPKGACVYRVDDVVKKKLRAEPVTCNDQTGQWYLSAAPEKKCKKGCKCYSIMEFKPNFQSFGWCKDGDKLTDYKKAKRHTFVEGECVPKQFKDLKEMKSYVVNAEKKIEALYDAGKEEEAEVLEDKLRLISERPSRPVYSKDPKFFSAVKGTTKIYEIRTNSEGGKTCHESHDLGIQTSKAEFSYDNQKIAFTQPTMLMGNESGYTGDKVFYYDMKTPEKGPKALSRDDEREVAYPAFLCNGNIMYIATLKSGKQVARIVNPTKPQGACKKVDDPFGTDASKAGGAQ